MPCTRDVLAAAEETFDPAVLIINRDGGESFYQLDRFVATRRLIATEVEKRLKGKRHERDLPWHDMVSQSLPALPDEKTERAIEKKAREEKDAHLRAGFIQTLGSELRR
ncbi:MAG: hypothetical protein AB1714_09715 [Acidobacteriota bacterium]